MPKYIPFNTKHFIHFLFQLFNYLLTFHLATTMATINGIVSEIQMPWSMNGQWTKKKDWHWSESFFFQQTNKAITIYWKNKHKVEFIGFDVFSLGHDFQRIYIDRITKTATRLNELDHTRNHFSRFNRIHKISKLNSQDFHCNESREFLFHFNECKKIIIVHFSFEWFRFIIQIDILAQKKSPTNSCS